MRNSLTKYSFVKILRRFTDYTKVIYHTINPLFNQYFLLPVEHGAGPLTLFSLCTTLFENGIFSY